MATGQMTGLHPLSDSGLTVKSPAEDIRGRKVLDAEGNDVGTVDDLLIDDHEQKVRFLRIASGGFLGFGETKFIVPVDAITRVTADEVHINRTRLHVAQGPAYDPVLANEQGYWAGVYRHYGYMPYWGMAYVYPSYPFTVEDPDSPEAQEGVDLAP